MANVQTIPVKEIESIYAHYSKKMSEASEALEKARAEYEELSEEYKMLPYSGMTESEKEIRKRQLWELIGRAKCECEVALASFTAYSESVEAFDYLKNYDKYQAL